MTDEEILGRLNGLALVVESLCTKVAAQQLGTSGMTRESIDVAQGDFAMLLEMALDFSKQGDFRNGMIDMLNGMSERIEEIFQLSQRTPPE